MNNMHLYVWGASHVEVNELCEKLAQSDFSHGELLLDVLQCGKTIIVYFMTS